MTTFASFKNTFPEIHLKKFAYILGILLAIYLVIIGWRTLDPTQNSSLSPEEAKLAEIYGVYPSSYKSTVQDYLDSVLLDPDSKKIEWLRAPKRDWYKNKSGITPGYLVCAAVNAKNGFGGYAGARTAWFIINNDTVVQADMSASSCLPLEHRFP